MICLKIDCAKSFLEERSGRNHRLEVASEGYIIHKPKFEKRGGEKTM